MHIPLELNIFDFHVSIHQVMEVLAYSIGFQSYLFFKRRASNDPYTTTQRGLIIVGAASGALLGSVLLGVLDGQKPLVSWQGVFRIHVEKTIVGGLIGGWVMVELVKKQLRLTFSSGDLFTIPIILGMCIGRIGCWLQGIEDNTYGSETDFFLGMDLGDGKLRHPTALYDIFFLLPLGLMLHVAKKKLPYGGVFLAFMVAYMGWRVCIDFLKPGNVIMPLIGVTLIKLTAFGAALVAGYRLWSLYRKEENAFT